MSIIGEVIYQVIRLRNHNRRPTRLRRGAQDPGRLKITLLSDWGKALA
jgi:hypothetical protein